jgi:hypothetical protein
LSKKQTQNKLDFERKKCKKRKREQGTQGREQGTGNRREGSGDRGQGKGNTER